MLASLIFTEIFADFITNGEINFLEVKKCCLSDVEVCSVLCMSDNCLTVTFLKTIIESLCFDTMPKKHTGV